MGCVYLAWCEESQKGYVGKTTYNLEDYKHGHRLFARNKSDRIFHRAIRKYGWNAFEWSILAEDDDEEWLFLMEQKWIKRLGTKMPNGYNMTDGGEGVSGLCLSKETREKMSCSQKGKKHNISEEGKQAIQEALRNRIWTDEMRERARKNRANQPPPSELSKYKMGSPTRGKTYEEIYGPEKGAELRAKRSKFAKERKMSEEQKARLSELNTGKKIGPFTQEHKDKISAALKRYFERKKGTG